jgi:ABC-type glycerol-3-phosphate transport system substrate-binding protein
MKMMLDKGYAAPGSLSHTENDVQNDLLSGKIAMCTEWEGTMSNSVDPKQTSKAVLGQIRMALIPGSAARKSGSCLGPEGWAIMKASPNQSQAKAFLNWQLTVGAQQGQMLRFDYLPIFTAMYADPSLRKLIAKTDGQDDYAVYGAQFAYSQPRPNFAGYVSASHQLQVQLQKAMQGSASVQQALNTAASQMQATVSGGNNP